MSSLTPLPPDACARLSRRGVLALPALAGAGAVLSGCGVLKKGDTASSGKSSGAASPRAVATATGPHGGVVLSTEYQGAPMTVEVGPVAVKGKVHGGEVSHLYRLKRRCVPFPGIRPTGKRRYDC